LFAAEGDADTEAAAAAEAAIARRFEQMAAAQAAEKAKQEANQELRESIWAAKRIENAVLDEPSGEWAEGWGDSFSVLVSFATDCFATD
jgi:hypothetical protein